jgi:glycosyltransferase involved in cell wall biosynthesis
MKVGIDARLEGGAHGGIEQVVIGLAAGLSRLDGPEQYLFLVRPGADQWIRPYLGGRCRLLVQGEPQSSRRLADRVRRTLQWRAPVLRRRWQRRWPPPIEGREADLEPRSEGRVPLEASDGTIETAGVDVMHFPHQSGFLTRLPTIYQPHDLQHLHHPDLFTEAEIESRELRYRTYCEQAELTVMMTSWGRQDLIEHYGLSPDKVAVVNWGSIIDFYPEPSEQDLADVRARLSLPEEFLLYPAQTWPHKNHERLFEALARIRDRDGVTVSLVCSGRQNEAFEAVRRRAEQLGISGQVLFPGFVTPLELRSLYRLARGLVFPSRFEGWGMPVSEAFSAGLPVASSSATGLGDVVDGAGLLFDPDDVEAMADAILRLWTDSELRADLAESGRRRAEEFSIDRAAKLFRAHYRSIGGRRLSAEDRELLDAAPLA